MEACKDTNSVAVLTTRCAHCGTPCAIDEITRSQCCLDCLREQYDAMMEHAEIDHLEISMGT